ncbi:MAG: folP [Ferruginibacter sp.]|nr:folP [Ferruginibacter sp.]
MGILNATPDSFYDQYPEKSLSAILAVAAEMISEGANILDIGGQSTRPGSSTVSADEETARVLPVIHALLERYPDIILSVDTFYSQVAAAAVNAGSVIVNDISAGNMDAAMLSTVAGLQVPYICMHMRGTPQTMQQYTTYDDIVKEVLDFFIHKLEECTKAGIKDIIIDPGFGFAKTIQQNFTLLKHLDVFRMLDKPILAGLSRKSTVYKTLNTTAAEALNGTTVLNTLALENGAGILRVHDVKEAKEVCALVEKYKHA